MSSQAVATADCWRSSARANIKDQEVKPVKGVGRFGGESDSFWTSHIALLEFHGDWESSIDTR
jgi:hypothetical protein